jgi:hypothetical protein
MTNGFGPELASKSAESSKEKAKAVPIWLFLPFRKY